MALRNVGMRAQPTLQRIAADFAEQRIVRVLRQPARERGEMDRQLKCRRTRVEMSAEEECDRKPITARRRRDDPVNVGFEVAVRRDLQDFTDVDDERPRNRRRFDPTVLAFDLQARNLVLQ